MTVVQDHAVTQAGNQDVKHVVYDLITIWSQYPLKKHNGDILLTNQTVNDYQSQQFIVATSDMQS